MQTTIETPRSADEPAFMRGYGDYAVKGENLNPYPRGSTDDAEYERGYAEAIADDSLVLE